MLKRLITTWIIVAMVLGPAPVVNSDVSAQTQQARIAERPVDLGTITVSPEKKKPEIGARGSGFGGESVGDERDDGGKKSVAARLARKAVLEDAPPLTMTEVAAGVYGFKSLEGDYVEVGAEDGQPYALMNRWDGEAWTRVSFPEAQADGELVLEDGIVKWKEEKREIHLYPVQPKEEVLKDSLGGDMTRKINMHGGLEWETVWKEKPASNVVEMAIETENLVFYYQEPLAAQRETWLKMYGPGTRVTANEVIGKDGTVWRYQPEYAIGSYAVYHASRNGDYTRLGGKNYRAGKAFHVYRPKIFDNTGAWVWGELNVDTEKGTMRVTVPWDFLETAVYPVVVDPNFGFDDTGSLGYNNGNERVWDLALGDVPTPASNGSLTSMSYYGRSNIGSPQFCPALYSNDADDTPLTRLAYVDSGGTAFGGGDGWVTTNISYGSIVSGTQYWLGEKSGNDSTQYVGYYDNAAANTVRYINTTGTWPATANDNAGVGAKVSIYATYDALLANGDAGINAPAAFVSTRMARAGGGDVSDNRVGL